MFLIYNCYNCSHSTSGPLSILRAFRIFHALRLLSISSMKKVIQVMFYLPGIASVGTIMFTFLYISSSCKNFLVTNLKIGLALW